MEDVRTDVSITSLQYSFAFTIVCGTPGLAAGVTDHLERCGFVADPTAPLNLVLDLPTGFAFAFLSHRSDQTAPVVVRTWNVSSAYLADLWELQPTVLLANTKPDLAGALVLAAYGTRYCCPPISPLFLTSRERQVLQALACGWDNKQIGDALGLRPQSVLNVVTQVLSKLHLRNRTAAALYYWGINPSLQSSSLATELTSNSV